MTGKNPTSATTAPRVPAHAIPPRVTRSAAMIELMRMPQGATAAELGAAVGWQRHSVRALIARTLRKRCDVQILTEGSEAGTRYRLVDKTQA